MVSAQFAALRYSANHTFPYWPGQTAGISDAVASCAFRPSASALGVTEVQDRAIEAGWPGATNLSGAGRALQYIRSGNSACSEASVGVGVL